jgi:hypothetical protein
VEDILDCINAHLPTPALHSSKYKYYERLKYLYENVKKVRFNQSI